jgi:D-glycerate 3-kinase
VGISASAAWDQADAAAAEAIVAQFQGTPLVVGLAGAQGSGKSTMAPRLAARLSAAGLQTEVLALDDFYLGHAERLALASAVHPLLSIRGVPGTHDVGLLAQVLDAIRAGGPARVAVPRFDKASDDRLPVTEWRTTTGPVDVVLLEGWCVGARPQPDHALVEPVNALEREEDADGRWRGWVNRRLALDYAPLFARLGLRMFLRAPSFDVVLGWRTEQERALAAQGMSAPELRRFVAHYERITRWMLEDEPADLVIDLDPSRSPSGTPRVRLR